MFATLFRKELSEALRTSRLLIYLAVFLISGLVSPLLAKYTPELLKAIPDLPAELAGIIPAPTLRDAVDQYVKNTTQFGILLIILTTMGSMAQEKERGTAAMLLIKPVRRSAVVLTKGLTVLSLVAAGLLLSTLGCALYTAILFEALPFQAFLILNLLLFLYFSVYVSITLLASTLARTQSVAAAGAFAGLALLLILGSIPRFGEYLPGKLLQWGTSGVLGDSITTWPALWVGLGIIAASFTIACLYFEKEEI